MLYEIFIRRWLCVKLSSLSLHLGTTCRRILSNDLTVDEKFYARTWIEHSYKNSKPWLQKLQAELSLYNQGD